MSLTFLAKSLRVFVEDVLRRPRALPAHADRALLGLTTRGAATVAARGGAGRQQELAAAWRSWSPISLLMSRPLPGSMFGAALTAALLRIH